MGKRTRVWEDDLCGLLGLRGSHFSGATLDCDMQSASMSPKEEILEGQGISEPNEGGRHIIGQKRVLAPSAEEE